VLSSDAGGETGLELANERAFRRNPAGIDALGEILLFVSVQDGLVYGDESCHPLLLDHY
jgi:hypothetical protein